MEVMVVNLDDRSALDDFRKFADFPAASLEKWGPLVPPQVSDVWRRWGLGDFLGGFLKVIDPEEFKPLLPGLYYDPERAVPVFATAFADLVVWKGEEIGSLITLEFRKEDILSSGLKYYFSDLSDPEFQQDVFDIRPYAPAVRRLGVPDYDECLAYEPLLALGGPERADHLSRVKLREHLVLMATLTDCLRG